MFQFEKCEQQHNTVEKIFGKKINLVNIPISRTDFDFVWALKINRVSNAHRSICPYESSLLDKGKKDCQQNKMLHDGSKKYVE